MEKKELVLAKLGMLFEGVFSLIGLGKYDILNLLLETIHAIISVRLNGNFFLAHHFILLHFSSTKLSRGRSRTKLFHSQSPSS